MKTRFIGNLEVFPIGMGCMGFSHGYGQVPEESYSIEAIRKVWSLSARKWCWPLSCTSTRMRWMAARSMKS